MTVPYFCTHADYLRATFRECQEQAERDDENINEANRADVDRLLKKARKNNV